MKYRRVLAVCYFGRLDVGVEFVRRGWALAYRRYGLTYVRQEAEARAAKTVETIRPQVPLKWPEDLERHLDSLRKAGLPG